MHTCVYTPRLTSDGQYALITDGQSVWQQFVRCLTTITASVLCRHGYDGQCAADLRRGSVPEHLRLDDRTRRWCDDATVVCPGDSGRRQATAVDAKEQHLNSRVHSLVLWSTGEGVEKHYGEREKGGGMLLICSTTHTMEKTTHMQMQDLHSSLQQ